MIISTNAIVLKTFRYGDSSIISRLFTEHYGKIVVIAKGILKPKNTTGPIMEPMNHITLHYYDKSSREIQILKNASLINQFSLLRSNLERIILGQIIVESLDKATSINNPMPILYRLIWRVLEKMNFDNVNFWMIYSFYLYQLAVRLGFMPNLTSCHKCHSILSKAFIDDYLGELICHSCNTQSKLLLDNKSLIFLQNMEKLHLDDIKNNMNTYSEMENVLYFLKKFNCTHMEGMDKVRSLDMIQKLLT